MKKTGNELLELLLCFLAALVIAAMFLFVFVCWTNGVEDMKTGIELIADERKRQIEVEGWTVEHDDEHPACNMALAGACYAINVAATYGKGKALQEMCDRLSKIVWPWDKKWWKPTPDDPIRQLVKAGALIAAEIDRYQRAKNSGAAKRLWSWDFSNVAERWIKI